MRKIVLLGAVAIAAAPVLALATDVGVGHVRGGIVNAFAFDGANAAIYAGVHGAGLFKSTNDGVSWAQIFLPSISSHFSEAVASTGGTVLVGEGAPSSAAIWTSHDGAASFTNALSVGAGYEAIAFAHATGSTWFAGVQKNGAAGVVKSTDGGDTWADLGLSVPGSITSEILSLPGGRLVAGVRPPISTHTLTGQVQYSDDGGGTWHPASTLTGAVCGLAVNTAGTFAVAETTDTVNTYLWTSPDGATWTMAKTVAAVTDFQMHTVFYDRGSDTFFALFGNDQLLQSAPGPGYSFGAAANVAGALLGTPPLSINHHMTFAATPAGTWLMGDTGGDGIFRSATLGSSWAISNDGLYAPAVGLAMKAKPIGYRYAANNSGFVFFSDAGLDGFRTIFRPTDITHDSVNVLAFDRADPRRVFVGSTNFNDFHVLKRTDDATAAPEDAYPFPHTAWVSVNYPTVPATTHVLSLLVNGSNLLAGVASSNNATAGNYLWRSGDGGTTWTAVSGLTTVGGVRTLAWGSAGTAVVYAGAGDISSVSPLGPFPAHGDGLWKSTDGGSTWTHLDSAPGLTAESPRTISVDVNDANRVWVMADPFTGNPNDAADIWESVDAGSSWTKITPTNVNASKFAMAYASSSNLLVLAGGGNGINVYVQTPGSGNSVWDAGFGVYGEASALYDGSIGIGTGTGLFEATNVTTTPVNPGGGSGGHHHGCNCEIGRGGSARAMAGMLLATLMAGALFVRRRGRRRGQGAFDPRT